MSRRETAATATALAGAARESAGLVRTIGRWSLAALMLNTMIGASIFGLPSLLAGYLGKYSPVAYLAAFVGVAVIAACLAEVASYFQEAGGPYLYTREAFGRFAATDALQHAIGSQLAHGGEADAVRSGDGDRAIRIAHRCQAIPFAAKSA